MFLTSITLHRIECISINFISKMLFELNIIIDSLVVDDFLGNISIKLHDVDLVWCGWHLTRTILLSVGGSFDCWCVHIHLRFLDGFCGYLLLLYLYTLQFLTKQSSPDEGVIILTPLTCEPITSLREGYIQGIIGYGVPVPNNLTIQGSQWKPK